MVGKRASLEEVAKNVWRKAKPNIDLGDGASDEVDEDELKEEFRKEKNYKYKHASQAWITATNQEVKELLQLSNLDQLDHQKVVVLGVTLHTLLRGRHVQ
jgi:hypothetical protein